MRGLIIQPSQNPPSSRSAEQLHRIRVDTLLLRFAEYFPVRFLPSLSLASLAGGKEQPKTRTSAMQARPLRKQNACSALEVSRAGDSVEK
jgi:hypothetical protein